ncbi:hypothetical protein PVK06_003153 [Gossypium arboreum]|uniref:CCHC-type domain-containing protein n=1 Tax=Gossypium arboreum TaxID=29729 RepID=A0ABR0R5F8_GOSAR|nr:hypothetical protein PVK06_003153 [Gossypium arboreum]
MGNFFYFVEGNFTRSSVNGILMIAFLDRVQNYLLKDMKTTTVIKLLGRRIGYATLQNRISTLWWPSKPFQLMDMENKIEYESLFFICFSCGQYGHVKKLCSFSYGDKEVVEVGEGSKAVNSTIGVSAEDTIEFGPWMVVEMRTHQNPKESRKPVVKIPVSVEEGSKFNAVFLGVNEKRERKDLKDDFLGIQFKKGDFLKLIENEAIKRKGAEGVRPKSAEGRVVKLGHGNLDRLQHSAVVFKDNIGSNATIPLEKYNREFKPDIVDLLETRVSGGKANEIIANLDFQYSHRVKAVGFS